MENQNPTPEPMSHQPLKVLYFGIYSKGSAYPRNNNLILGLRTQKVQVVEAHFSVSESFQERMDIVGSSIPAAGFSIKLVKSFFILTWKFLSAPRVDAIIVGHPGYFHIHLSRFLRTLFKKKAALFFDVFIPLYDTLVVDRKLLKTDSLRARLLRRFEASCCQTADACLIDTHEHRRYLVDTYGLSPDHVHRVFVGPTIRNPLPFPGHHSSEVFNILYCGTYIPLHGVDIILEAAEKLKSHQEIQFTMVGSGQLKNQMTEFAQKLKLPNVQFRDWVPTEEIPEIIRSCHLSLGIFGSTPKTKRVIPSKIFDICAVGAPFVTADTTAVREVFTHGENAYLIPVNDPEALTEAILKLISAPELMRKIATGAAQIGKEQFSIRQIGKTLVDIIRQTIQISM
jgi:glycosyltransferase involved in cell wall biosynthesis